MTNTEEFYYFLKMLLRRLEYTEMPPGIQQQELLNIKVELEEKVKQLQAQIKIMEVI